MAPQELGFQNETFRFKAADALSVMLVGDFTHWQANPIPMRKGPEGIWTAKVNLGPGTHTYRFIVDGEWRDDPECALHVANPFGSEDRVRRIT